MKMPVSPSVAVFEGFRLDRRGGGLFRVDGDGRPVPVGLGVRALDLLGVLLERAGEEVGKHTIMEAVWPDVAVEENNLTVQISTLRRVLDNGRTGSSCIQTVTGRGYRFIAPVAWLPSLQVGGAAAGATPPAGTIAAKTPPCPERRLSVAVLPFASLDGDAEQIRVAEGVTQDLTTDLASVASGGAFVEMVHVVSRRAVEPYAGGNGDVHHIGAALRVRYAVEGSLRRIGETTRVNIAIIATETARQLWTNRFDVPPQPDAGEQESIRRWVSCPLYQQLFAIEAARSLRERPDTPDVLDLLIEANALVLAPPSLPRSEAAEALFQRALEIDPSLVPAMTGLAGTLLDRINVLGQPPAGPVIARTRALLEAAEFRQPNARAVQWIRAHLLRTEERWPEAEAAFRKLTEVNPIAGGVYFKIGTCKLKLGLPEEAIGWFERAIRSDPRSQMISGRYFGMCEASLLLGRYEDSIAWAQRALAANPELPAVVTSLRMILMAGAYALLGRLDEARACVTEGNRVWPYLTASEVSARWDSSALASNGARIRHALGLAGLRDHVDEDADARIPPQSGLHDELVGPTPLSAPGVTTVRTGDLVRLASRARPLMIDVAGFGRSVAGAVGLPGAGGGRGADDTQSRLGRRMAELTGGDRSMPLVTIGGSAERREGYNLALRLVHLGYGEVCWYRGGRSAWRLAGQPLADLDLREW